MNKTNQIQNDSRNRINVFSTRCRQWSKYAVAGLVLVACALCAVPLRAQTATFRSPQLRVTVPLNYNGTFLLVSNVLTVRTNGATIAPDGTGSNWLVGPLNFDVSGAPAGVTATVVDTNLNPVTTWTPHLNTNSTSTSSNLLVLLTFDGTEAEGLSTLSFNVTGGVTNNIFLEVQVGSFWTGTTNVTTAWSSTASWVSGVLPTNVDDVLFTQLGAQTNVNVGTNLTIAGNMFVNSIIDQNFTINSLRFMTTNSSVRFHTLRINPGVTLAVAGTNGFSIIKDYLNGLYPAGAGVGGVSATFTGIGGTLIVTNEVGNFNVLVDNNAVSVGNGVSLDMASLGTFIADVNAFDLGDATFWPNFRNLNDLNAYNGQPRACNGNMNLARTNVIKAIYADPFNYTNADRRRFSFNILNSEVTGSTTVETFNLGISNSFFLDSINFGGGNARLNAQFSQFRDTNIVVGVSTNFFTNTLTAIFRGTNGGRMSVFSISDGAGTNTSASSPNNNISFAGGTVDILADRFYIGRDRKTIPIGQNPSYVGNFFMTQGSVDVNTAILGFREYNQTNALLGQVSLGYCVGRITVSNSAVFKVNRTLTMGSTVATNANEESSGGNCDQGQISVAAGGTLIASNIYVGGPIYGISRNNNIIVSNSSLIIISNNIASTNQYLDQFSLANGSTLQLPIDGTHSGAYVFTTNLTFSSTTTNNVVKIASMANLPPNAEVPVIYHRTATAGSLPTVQFPIGFTGSGSLLDNGANNTIDLLVSTIPPKSLIWRGAPGAVWDLTTKNWQDFATGLMTNFNNFDVVAFDDAAGHATNISVTDVVIPGAVNMTNNSLYYTFVNGGGSISGSGLFNKRGTAILEIEVVSPISYLVTQGTLTNGTSGTLGGVTVSAGSVFANAGTVNNGIDCSGLATISSGVVNGPLTVESGGVVTNLATIQGGAFTVQGGGFLYNGLSATMDNFGASTVVSNATLINDGFLGDQFGGFVQSLTVSGTLEDTGASGLPSMSLQTLTINQGAVFIPGGDGIGTTSVRNPLGGSTNGNPGRVIFSSGSTNIFKVDAGTLASTRVLSGYQDFGPSQSSQLQNGCTLVITNVSGTPFAAGQFFRLVGLFSTSGNPIATGTATNSFPVIVPAKPGPGLIWDLTRLWGNNGSGNWGYIGVAIPGIVHLTNSFSLPDGTNIVGQFSWPATNYGWRLQTLSRPTTVGLTPNTNWNWTGIAGSWTNLSMTLSNKISDDVTNSVFYRLVYP